MMVLPSHNSRSSCFDASRVQEARLSSIWSDEGTTGAELRAVDTTMMEEGEEAAGRTVRLPDWEVQHCLGPEGVDLTQTEHPTAAVPIGSRVYTITFLGAPRCLTWIQRGYSQPISGYTGIQTRAASATPYNRCRPIPPSGGFCDVIRRICMSVNGFQSA